MNRSPKLRSNWTYFCFCAALSLLVALRGDTRDTAQYLAVYLDLVAVPWNPVEFQQSYQMEWGFGLLAGSVKSANLPPEILFFIISALTFYAITIAATRFGIDRWSVLPYYLPTFFLTQQLMQVRQGLAVAIAFCAVALLQKARPRALAVVTTTTAASLFHIVSIVPIIAAVFLRNIYPKRRSWRNWCWGIGGFLLVAGACKYIASTEILGLTARIGTYLESDDYGSARSLLEPANIRAALLSLVFFYFRPTSSAPCHRAYMILVGLYITHLGVRVGFIDIAILSGRIGSAMGFAEVFLLPLIVKDRIPSAWTRAMFAAAYLSLHLSIALIAQLPFLVSDYFRPIN